MVTVNGRYAVYWRTSLQTTLAQFVDEAEIMAGNEGARQIMYMQHLIEELGLPAIETPVLKVDNAGVYRVAGCGPGERTKHLKLQQLYVHGLSEEGELKVATVKSEDNVADVLTKCCNSKQMYRGFLATRMGNFADE